MHYPSATGPHWCGGCQRGRRARADSRRRAKSHISDLAPLVWRVLEGPEGPAAVSTNNRSTQPKQISHAIPPRHGLTRAQKPQNINDQISIVEILLGELHAKLPRCSQDSVPCRDQARWCGGRRRVWRVWRRCRWAEVGPGRTSRRRAKSHINDLAPLVWRTSESPEGPAAAPVDNGARPRCLWTAAGKPRQISHVISLGHFLRPPENVAIPTVRIQCLK